MKPVSMIRPVIAGIPGVIYDVDPEDRPRGEESGVVTLWEAPDAGRGESDTDGLSDNSSGIDDEMELEGTPPAVEEIFEVGATAELERFVQALGGAHGELIREAIQCHRRFRTRS